MIRTAHLIYFSPTGTTRMITTSLAQGLGADSTIHYDLTLPDSSNELVVTDGVAIIGIPVYAGRVPETVLERISGLTASNVPAILIALYGNREFEDSLVELLDVSKAQGFNVVAAGAFIGEHSYSTPDRPIAADRPDDNDLSLAITFGEQVAEKIERGDFTTPEIDGNIPFKDRVKFGGISPETTREKCALCGQCAEVCPTGVITVSETVTTNADKCIMCCACVKVCEFGARPFDHPIIEERRAMLLKNCSEPKAPSIFL